MQKRVVVTGLGLISPIGNDIATAWQACRNGESGISRISRFDPSRLKTQIAGEVKDFVLPDVVSAKDAKKMDLFMHYAIAAAHQALGDAGLVINEGNADDIGVSFGVGIGGQITNEKNIVLVNEKGPAKLSPFYIPMILPNMVAGQLSLTFGTKNYCACTLSACASSNHAIGDGFRIIQRGDAKAMIVGGTDASLTEVCLGGFAAMRALSTRNDSPAEASRPYDTSRDGFVFSEGSGVLVLEELEQARSRGAPIYGELAGYGFSSDAHHISFPTVDGPHRALSMAIRDAGVDPSQIDYINAHATSTPAGDINELQAIKAALGSHASRVSISATKSMTGHLLGAAGAIEAVISVKALQENFVPPSINIDELDAECDLDVTPNEGRSREIGVVVSNSFGFGGTNATLLFKQVN